MERLFQYLTRIQAKPEHVRRRIALVATALIFAGIVTVVVTSGTVFNGEVEGAGSLANTNASVSGGPEKPFDAIKDIFSTTVDAVGKAIDQGPPPVLKQ
jgi:hypothetical protein